MTTLAPLIDRYLDQRRRLPGFVAGTERHYRRTLRSLDRAFGGRPLSHLSPSAVERWLGTTTMWADSTRRLALSDVRAFCGWLAREGLIRVNPAGALRVAKVRRAPRALHPAQVGALLRCCPDERTRLVALLMVELGLRCCEVAAARVADYNSATGDLRVRGKGGHERTLPVVAAVRAALTGYLAGRGYLGGALISSKTEPGAHVTALYLSTMLSRLMGEAGIKSHRFDGVSAHALRHTCASDVLERSGDLRAVQDMLGHQSLATTSIYLRSTSSRALRQAMEGRLYDAA